MGAANTTKARNDNSILFRYSKYDGLARTGCRESKVPYIDMALVSHVWWWVDYIP